MNKKLIIKIITVSVIFLVALLSQKAVNAVSILNCSVSLSKSEYIYDGTSKKPTVVIKYNGKKVDKKNYKVEYVNNIRVGTATVNITGKNSLSGRITKSFKIKSLKLTSKNVSFRYTDSWKYTGKEIKPALKIIFHNYQILGSNYNIKYENNVKLGEAKIIITGKNNCSGKVTKTFKIYEDITKAQVEFNESNYVYSGNEIKPRFKLKIHNKVVDSKNYSVKFSNNINASNKAKITITGKNNYRGELIKTFTIEQYDLSNIIIYYTLKFQWNGQDIDDFKYALKHSKTGKVYYTDGTYNIDGNTYKWNIEAKYITGSEKTQDRYIPKPINNISNIKIYNIMKDSKNKLKQDKDYTIESSKVGNKKIFKIKGKGNYKGTKTINVKTYDV